MPDFKVPSRDELVPDAQAENAVAFWSRSEAPERSRAAAKGTNEGRAGGPS